MPSPQADRPSTSTWTATSSTRLPLNVGPSPVGVYESVTRMRRRPDQPGNELYGSGRPGSSSPPKWRCPVNPTPTVGRSPKRLASPHLGPCGYVGYAGLRWWSALCSPSPVRARRSRHPTPRIRAPVTRPMDATRRVEAPAPALTMPEPVACPAHRLTSALAAGQRQHIERPPGDLDNHRTRGRNAKVSEICTARHTRW